MAPRRFLLQYLGALIPPTQWLPRWSPCLFRATSGTQRPQVPLRGHARQTRPLVPEMGHASLCPRTQTQPPHRRGALCSEGWAEPRGPLPAPPSGQDARGLCKPPRLGKLGSACCPAPLLRRLPLGPGLQAGMHRGNQNRIPAHSRPSPAGTDGGLSCLASGRGPFSLPGRWVPDPRSSEGWAPAHACWPPTLGSVPRLRSLRTPGVLLMAPADQTGSFVE